MLIVRRSPGQRMSERIPVRPALLSPFCRRSERRRYFRAYLSVADKKPDPQAGVMIATATREKAKDHNPALTCADDSSIFIKKFNDMW